MLGSSYDGLKPGQWTDDTSMALCLAESLIEKRGFDPKDQMDRYCRWWKKGYLSSTGSCFDIGITVKTALAHYLRTGESSRLNGPIYRRERLIDASCAGSIGVPAKL